ncbi:AMP-binding protein [bacterium]|nr:AMP-binding protein [bacterium]
MTTYDEKPWLKHYDKHVTPEIPVPEISYLKVLERGLSHDPDRIALHFLGTTCTYRQLDDLSSRFAAYLADKGCVKGDVIGINLPNIPQYSIAKVGISKVGGVISGVSPLLTPKELAHQLKDSKAKVLITLDILFQERLLKISEPLPDLKQIVVTNVADYLSPVKQFLGKLLKKIPSGKISPLSGKEIIPYKKLISSYPAEKPTVEISPDDTCLLQYTGGTTGPSKGTILTHRNIVFNIAQLIQGIDQSLKPDGDIFDCERGQDIVCSGFPFFHQAGLILGLIHLCLGNTQILVPDPRNTTQICKDIDVYKPTSLVNVPTLYQLMMENPLFKTIDLSSIKYCMSGAAPFDNDSFRLLESFVGEGKVVELYGMTETSPLITINPIFGKKKIGSVGIPAQNTRVKIVDTETGEKEMPVGEPGELIVNGPQVMKGYHGNPKATAETIRDFKGEKWLYTGDVAKMDEDGYFFIVDRTKDMLLVGGFNVYSKQIEETLYEIPEVDLCAIIGKPNPDRPGSELVKAVIQLTAQAKGDDPKALEEKIIAHCKENLAAYKVPRIIEFVNEIPLTAVGKIDKKALRIQKK